MITDPRKQAVWRVLWIVLAVLVCPTAPARADEHPGHGSKVVLGTLKDVTPVAIVVEVLDPGGVAPQECVSNCSQTPGVESTRSG